MIEIILVYFMCKGIGNVLRAKGRKPLFMQIALVVCWIGGEIMGALVAGVLAAMRNEPIREFDMSAYLYALVGAALGAGLCFSYSKVTHRGRENEYEYEDE